MDEDANVFKLIGPALIKQDLVEAKSNVTKRLEFIRGELERADSQIKSLEGKSKDKEAEVRVVVVCFRALGRADRWGFLRRCTICPGAVMMP